MCLVAMVALVLSSQDSNAQGQIGVRGGVNLTSWDWTNTDGIGDDFFTGIGDDAAGISADGIDESSYRMGFHAGVYSTFDLGVVTISPEVLYSQKGGNKIGVQNNDNTKFLKSRQHYISVPVLFGIQLFDAFSLQVGPQVGYAFKTSIEGETIDTYDTDYYEDFDFGAVLGLTFDIAERANIGLRYNHGLAGLLPGTGDFQLQNRNFQVTAGIPLFNGANRGRDK